VSGVPLLCGIARLAIPVTAGRSPAVIRSSCPSRASMASRPTRAPWSSTSWRLPPRAPEVSASLTAVPGPSSPPADAPEDPGASGMRKSPGSLPPGAFRRVWRCRRQNRSGIEKPRRPSSL